MTKRQFVLVVVDRDTSEFTVEGPMSDDRLWNSAVVNAQGSAATSDASSSEILHRMSLQPNGTRLTGVAGLRLVRSCGRLIRCCIDKGTGSSTSRPPRVNWHRAVNTARKWPLSAARRPLMHRRCHDANDFENARVSSRARPLIPHNADGDVCARLSKGFAHADLVTC